MGSGSATGFFYAVRLVHSLLKMKYFFKFQLWYWIQIYTTKYSNLLLIILILVWIVCSTYREKEKFWCKSDMSPANLFTVTTCHTKWSRSGIINHSIIFIIIALHLWLALLVHCVCSPTESKLQSDSALVGCTIWSWLKYFLAHPVRRTRWAYAMVWRPSSVRPSVLPSVLPSFRPSTVFKMLLLHHFSTDFDSDCFIR